MTGSSAAAAVSVRDARPERAGVWPIVLPVAWGVLLFGAVYPWAYWPLLLGIAVVGAHGWARADPRDRAPARVLGVGLLSIVVIGFLQLVPLPGDVLARFSPATDRLLQQYDVSYAIARGLGQPAWHSLSIAPDATRRGLAFLLALTVFAVGCTAMLHRVRLGRLVVSLIVLGCALAIFGIFQRATFNDRIYWVWEPINVAANAFGPFVNRNHFAGWMLMTASVAAGYLCGLLASGDRSRPASWQARAAWLSSPDASRITLVGVALLVMVLSIVWTLSRSGIAAMAVAGALLGLQATLRLKGRGRLVGTWFVLAALTLAVVWRGLGDVADWYGRTSSLAWRIQLWNDTMPIVRDFRWFGTGLNTYGVSTLVYPMTYPELHAVEAHNDYLQIVSEGGIVLAAAVLATVLWLARSIYRAFAVEQSTDVYWVRIGAVTGMIAIAIQESVDFSLQMPGNAVLFAVLIAIALHRPALRRRRSRPDTALDVTAPPVPLGTTPEMTAS